MATINLGRIKPVFRGAYSGSTAYVVDDIVTDGNETFICIQAHGAGTQATSVTAYWSKLAAKGGDVTQLTTQGDILYRDGSGVARLAAGTAGQFLKTGGAGANPSWAGSGLAIQAVHTASTLTAVAGRAYPINTTSNACTVTLPASATAGDEIKFIDYARTWSTNSLTINQNSLKFQGQTTPNAIYSSTGQSVTILYVDATQGWIPTVDDDTSYKTKPPYDLDYLVVGGAGGGGSDSNDASSNNSSGGGGGAGGFRTGTVSSISGDIVLTATVGGGATGGGVNATAPSGTASSMAGSGITTIASAGGGGGGGETKSGAAGGSGGGGGQGNDGPSGSGGAGNTPSTSPVQGYAGGAADGSNGGGGGGASEAGDTDGTGYGGDGATSSITGSSVTYAGGGGSGSQSSPATPGGDGGGATGNNSNTSSSPAASGTDGLGGGGAGCGGASSPLGQTGGSGGDGVVIFSVPTASYSGTTTGSPTITTSGSDTIIKFTATGTYTT